MHRLGINRYGCQSCWWWSAEQIKSFLPANDRTVLARPNRIPQTWTGTVSSRLRLRIWSRVSGARPSRPASIYPENIEACDASIYYYWRYKKPSLLVKAPLCDASFMVFAFLFFFSFFSSFLSCCEGSELIIWQYIGWLAINRLFLSTRRKFYSGVDVLRSSSNRVCVGRWTQAQPGKNALLYTTYVQNFRQTPHRCCGLLTPKFHDF